MNKQKVIGTVKVQAGDVVQLGPSGPEFQFDLDPPVNGARPTRIGSEAPTYAMAPSVAETRIGNTPVNSAPQVQVGNVIPNSAPAANTQPKVGKATVERMISDTRKNTQKQMFIGVGALLTVLAVTVGGLGFYFKKNKDDSAAAHAAEEKNRKEAINSLKPTTMDEATIATKYTDSVVKIYCGWKLTTMGGEQLYYKYVPNKDPQTGQPLIVIGGQQVPEMVPAFMEVKSKQSLDQNGEPKLEPILTLETTGSAPIGGAGAGTGFVVTSDGYILTNYHVATPWKTSYHFPQEYGIQVQAVAGKLVYVREQTGKVLVVPSPHNWVPSETLQAGGAQGHAIGGGVRGVNTRLDVVFKGNANPVSVSGEPRSSQRHDVALLKVNIPQVLTTCELNDSYDTTQIGDKAMILGYPALTRPQYSVIFSQDMFNRTYNTAEVPVPTLSSGNVGAILRGQSPLGGKDMVVSSAGDYLQLTVNSTGPGNSGGPVFDDHGKVIGIYSAWAGDPGGSPASVSLAIPIRYGKELMGIAPIKN